MTGIYKYTTFLLDLIISTQYPKPSHFYFSNLFFSFMSVFMVEKVILKEEGSLRFLMIKIIFDKTLYQEFVQYIFLKKVIVYKTILLFHRRDRESSYIK